ncbi:MAG TPA: acyl-CoA thioester hydrolase/BAAT C-terminal domain-containing protein [Solirubrobacteraceae bacterium]|nr:acyl-CoA thioester hydrolase/BAAT C-terminal domain-containing protein [Solirubrobacteraceae bacterium]
MSCQDARGVVFRSDAGFVADEAGVVDPTRHPATGPAYTAVDPYGLWWSAAPARPTDALFPAIATTVEAVADGVVVERVEFERRWFLDGMAREPVSDEGLVGALYLPRERPAAGVIVLGGSEGGLVSAEPAAAALAYHGLAALALASFGLPGLPRRLADIPLEYFETALAWLAGHEAVAGRKLGVLGRSRGGELALLLGATFSSVGAVVGIVPSGVLWGGWGTVSPVARPRPAWTHGGRPLPAVPSPGRLSVARAYARHPVALRPLYEEAVSQASSSATIPVERTAGPILLVSGGDDQMWPSGRFAEMVTQRLRDHGRGDDVVHLHHPAAGHLAGSLPFLPAGAAVTRHPQGPPFVSFKLGGTRAADGRAASESWPHIVDFLRGSLTER